MIYARETLDRKTPSMPSFMDQAGVIIPTWNAGKYWPQFETSLRKQGIAPDRVLIVDSSSTDNTRALVQKAGYRLEVIPQESFRHGGTRQFAAELMPESEILVYLTQDVLLCGDRPLEKLVTAFSNPEVGGCYGRQLPRLQAGPIERHARLFNYPATPDLRSFADREELGIRTAFFSDSFAAYRRTALDEAGGFPDHTIVSEDVTVAAHMLIAGWKIAYQPDATVIHSHDLSLRQEFSRYFDIGVHHGREGWILDAFGRAGGEGKQFVTSEARYLFQNQPSLLVWATLRNASKWCAYQLGRHERCMPQDVKEALSAQKGFWLEERRRQEISSHQAAVTGTPPEIPHLRT